ncbi:MAG: tetraacyldisaccharide 4'-kinase [Phycisphaerales bacterium]
MSAGESQRAGPLGGGPFGRALGGLIAPFYGAVMARRNARFDRGTGVRALPVPVISVGNLSVGGTGKTPTVAWLIERLLEAGHHPLIAMRGYKGGAQGAHSDEAAEYRARLQRVPLAVGADRLAHAREVIALGRREGRAVDCVVLDDGFQHRQLARDLDIVLLDATRDVFADRLLPAGWLREPPESLRRAGVVILTHAESVEPGARARMLARAMALAPSALVTTAQHETDLSPLGAARPRVVVFCGIGNPQPFLNAVATRAEIVESFVFEDHAVYTAARLRAIEQAAARSGATMGITTGKDWPTVQGAQGLSRLVLHALPLAIRIEDEPAILARVLGAIASPTKSTHPVQ